MNWAILILIAAIAAALFGFGIGVGVGAQLAKLVFAVLLILFVGAMLRVYTAKRR